MSHAEPTDPPPERLGETCVDVITMAVKVIGLSRQHSEHAIGQEVDVKPGVRRAPDLPDDGQIEHEPNRQYQELCVERPGPTGLGKIDEVDDVAGVAEHARLTGADPRDVVNDSNSR